MRRAISSPPPKETLRGLTQAKCLRGIFPVWVSLGALLIALSVPRNSRASSGHLFLETLGLSIAAGTVLGASTLPFYDQPGTHLGNLAYGASLGAVAGLGIGLYQIISGRSSRELFDNASREELFPGDVAKQREGGALLSDRAFQSTSFSHQSESRYGLASGPLYANASFSRPALIWAPLVSLTW